MNVCDLIAKSEEVIYYTRIQNYHESNILLREIINEVKINPLFESELQNPHSELVAVLQSILNALAENDIILVADYLAEGLLPLLRSYLTMETPWEQGEYRVEPTSSGYWTLFHKRSGIYMHSNGNPMEDARILSEQIFDPMYSQYSVWGCGGGYHILQLYRQARGAIAITVFDTNQDVFDIAGKLGILAEIPQERLRFVVDPNAKEFAHSLESGESGCLMHLPSVMAISNGEIKESMMRFFAGFNGTIQFKKELAINYRSNLEFATANVDQLRNAFFGRDVVFVAGGPSLDHNLDWLKESKGDKLIVAATTVLAKLLREEIIPDYALVMDSQKRTYGHMKGIEACKVPLIIDSTAYWEFAAHAAGKVYIAYQQGYTPAEDRAHAEGKTLYETGGSVTTLALDILLKSGVRRLFLLGVDLAYPEGISHATGTMDRKQRDVNNLTQVRSVTGGAVYTDSLFNGYRRWIERKLSSYPKIDVYNLSDSGAYIQGTKTL